MSLSITDAVRRVKNELVALLPNLGATVENLLSITFVGSHADGKKEAEVVNDFDVVFVFTELTRESYSQLFRSLEQFSSRQSTGDLGVIVETRFGPFKTRSLKPYTVQIHAIIYDLESLREYRSFGSLILFDWQRYAPSFGKSLRELADVSEITEENVLKDRGGLRYVRTLFETGAQPTLEMSFTPDGEKQFKRAEFRLTPVQFAEALYKNIRTVLENTHKVHRQSNTKPSSTDLDNLTRELLGEEGAAKLELLREAYVVSRTGALPGPDHLEQWKKDALEILDVLEGHLTERLSSRDARARSSG